MTKTPNNSYITTTPVPYANGGVPIILLDILIDPDTNTYLYYSSKSVTIDGRSYVGKILNIAEIKAAIGAGLDNISVTLENTEYLDGTRVSTYIETYGILRKDIWVYQYFENDTDSLAKRDLLFYGVAAPTSKGIVYNKESISIDIEDKSATYHKLIGKTYEEFGYTEAPDDVKTSMMPLVYGRQSGLKLNPVSKKVEAVLRFPISAVDDQIELNEDTDFTSFPTSVSDSEYFHVRIGTEVIRYSSISNNRLVVYKEAVGSLSSVSTTSANNVLTGSGTSWKSQVKVGDLIKLVSDDNTKWVRVISVDSDTQITIDGAWKSTTSLPSNLEKHGRGQEYFSSELNGTYIDKTLPENHESGAKVSLLRPVKFIGCAGTNRSNSNLFSEDTITNLQTLDANGTLKALPTKFVNGASGYLLPGRDLDNPTEPIFLSKWDKETYYPIEGLEPEFIIGDIAQSSTSDPAFFCIGAISKFNAYQVYQYAPSLGDVKWRKIWDSRYTYSGITYLDPGSDGIQTYNAFGGICNFDKDGTICWMVGISTTTRRLYTYNYLTNTYSYKDCNLGGSSGEIQYIAHMNSGAGADDSDADAILLSVGVNDTSASYPFVMNIHDFDQTNPEIGPYATITSLDSLRDKIVAGQAKHLSDWIESVNNTTYGKSVDITSATPGTLNYVVSSTTSSGTSTFGGAKSYSQDNLTIVTSVYDPYRRYASFNDMEAEFAPTELFFKEVIYRLYGVKHSTSVLYGQHHIMVGNYKYQLRSSTTDDSSNLGDPVDFLKAYASCVFIQRSNDEKIYAGLVQDTDGASVNVDVYALNSDTRIVGSGEYSSGTGYIEDTDAFFLTDIKVGDVVEVVEYGSDLTQTFSVVATKTMTASDIVSDTEIDMSSLGLSDATRYLYRIKSGFQKKANLIAQITLQKDDNIHDLYCQSFLYENDIIIMAGRGVESSAFNIQRIPLIQESLSSTEYNIGAIFSHWPTLPQESSNYYTTSQPLDSGEDNSYNTVNGIVDEWKKAAGNQVIDFTNTNGIILYHTPNSSLASDRTDSRASRITLRADEIGHREGAFRLSTNKGKRVREAYIRVNYFAPKNAAMSTDTVRVKVSGSTFLVSSDSAPYTITEQAYVNLPTLDDSVPSTVSDAAPITFVQKVEGISEFNELINKDITLEWQGTSATAEILVTEIAWDVSVFEDTEEDIENIYADIAITTGDFYHSSDTQGSSDYDNFSDGMNPLRLLHDLIEEGYEGEVVATSSFSEISREAQRVIKLNNGWLLSICNDVVSAVSTNARAYRSKDGGKTWQRIATIRTESAGSSQTVCYGLVQLSNSVIYTLLGNTSYELYKSVDQGVTWSLVTVPSYPGILVAGNLTAFDDDRLVLSGDQDFATIGEPALIISDDGGATWTYHLVDGTTSSIVQRVLKATDDTIYAISQDKIYKSVDNAASFSSVSTLPAGKDPYTALITSDDEVIVTIQDATTTNVIARISRDAGSNWTDYPIVAVSTSTQVNALHQVDDVTLLAGTQAGLYLSNDRGQTWSDLQANSSLQDIFDIVSVSKQSVVYVGGDSSFYASNTAVLFDLPFNFGQLGREYSDLINETSFDAAATRLVANNIRCNGTIVNRQSSKDLIEQICYQFRLHHWWDEDGKLNVVYKEDLSDYGSATRTIDADYILDLKGPQITVPSTVFSKFKVKYDRTKLDSKNTQDYKNQIDRDVSPLRSFGLIENEDINVNFIADATTAKKLSTQIEQYNTNEYKLFSIEGTMNEMVAERMDIVAVANTFETITKGFITDIRRTFGNNRYFLTIRKIT